MKKYLILIIPILLLAGCGKKNSFTISGTIKNKDHKSISIFRNDVNTSVFIDSVKIGTNGSFRIRVEATEPDFYQLGYTDDFITLLALPGDKIKIEFGEKKLCNDYKINGSDESDFIRTLDLRLIKTKAQLDSINSLYEKEKNNSDFETRGKELENQYIDILQKQRNFNIGFIIEHTTSLASIKAVYQRITDNLYVLYQTRDLQYMKILSDSLRKYYPESRHTKALVADFANEMGSFYTQQIQEMSGKIKETVLDPDLKDINGKRIKLSSLRGKYVLLTFWSVNSQTSVTENLQLKEFYKLYNKKGFEIYQINIDQDEALWKTAVKFDELPWISTREDDPANPVNAKLYNVQALPTNYLYDPKGNVIGNNLHGKALQLKLNQLFGN